MKTFIVLITALLTTVAFTQTTDRSGLFSDDVRLDELRAKFADGVATVDAVTELRNEAFSRFDAGDCERALPALETFSNQANQLANVLSSTLEPFYDTFSSDRESGSYGPGGISALAAVESTANQWKFERNEAFVAMGECHEELGNDAEALTYYGQALDLLQAVVRDRGLWIRAREGVYRVIGHSTP